MATALRTAVPEAEAAAIDPVERAWTDYPAATVTADHLTPDENRFVTVTSLALAFLVFTMKIAPFMNIELGVYAVLPFAGWALAAGHARISPLRLFGFLLTGAGAVVVTFAAHAHEGFSITALLFLIVLHLPFVLIADVRRVVYLKLLKNFQIVAGIIAFMVFFQWGQQVVGMKMLNMEDYLPKSIMFDSYNYVQKVNYFSRWYKPNAFFMLETSHTSQIISIGLAIELCFLRRMPLVLFFAIALVMSFGGTGTLMTVLAVPLYLLYLSRRTLIAGLCAAPLALLVAAKAGFLENAVGRSQEFGEAGTSGSGRFVAPFQVMYRTFTHLPDTLFTGIGPGVWNPFYSSHTDMLNPIAKITTEYGALVGLAWFAWFHACVFTSRVPVIIIFLALAQYDMTGGGLLVPIQTYYCLFLCAMVVPARRTAPAALPRPRIPALRLRPRTPAAA